MAEDHAGDPAQAFEDLRAEVSVLRRAIEALPAAIRENRPADYSADLGVLGKGLDEISEQLEAITKSPALMMTPAQQGESIAKAGNNLVREAAGRLSDAVRTIEGERLQLSQIVGQAWKQDRQWRLMWLVGGVALAVGLALSPLVAGVLPFGLNTRVARPGYARGPLDGGYGFYEGGQLGGMGTSQRGRPARQRKPRSGRRLPRGGGANR